MRAWLSFALAVASVAAPSFGSPLLGAGPAEAQRTRRVVVERFSGPRGSTVRRALIRDLEDNGVEVIDEDEDQAARRRLGLGRSLDAEEYVELGRALRASAFIDGRVRRRRRRWSADVRVINARDGEELGDASWAGRTASALRGVGVSGFDRLERYLDRSRAPGAAAVEAAASDGRETPWWERQETDSPIEDEDPRHEEEEDEEPGVPRERSTRYDGVRIMVLGGTLFRSMETVATVYETQRGLAATDPAADVLNETRRYVSGGIGHFELGLRAELYPGAFDPPQSFPYLGVVFQFTHSLGVSSNGFDRMTGEPVTVPTDQLELFIGGRLRYRTGELRGEPELHLEVGWGTFTFDLGLDELQRIELDTIIPPMQHGYLQLAGGVEYGVAPPYLTLGLEVGGRLGTNIGGDTRNVWGTATAPSNGLLLGANARVEIPELFDTFFIGVSLRYFMFVTAFSGQVGCAIADECSGFMNPWEDRRLWEVWPVRPPPPGGMADLDDVVGGPAGPVTDHYVRLQLAVGAGFN